MKKTLFTLLAAAAVVGCSKSEEVTQSTSNDEVKFNSKSIGTRTTTDATGADSWEIGDAIGIFTSGFDTEYYNVKYLAEDADTATDFNVDSSNSAIVFPNVAAGTVKFYAYYPYVATDNNIDTTNETVLVNISGQKGDINKVDFMTAVEEKTVSNHDDHEAEVEFEFYHKLAKVEITVGLNNNLSTLTGLTAALNDIDVEAKYDYTTGVIEESQITTGSSNFDLTVDVATPIASENITEATITAILHPHDYSGTDITTKPTMTFAVGSRTFSVTFAPTLTAGNIHYFYIDLGNDNAVFKGSSIKSWNDPEGSTATDLYPEETTTV